MSDEPVTTDEPASEPADAEIEHRAMALAKADGLNWAAPGTPDQAAGGHPGSATNEDRERYRKLAHDRLQAERGLIV
jgi:hypothetical protein